jgi:hypothetical protein
VNEADLQAPFIASDGWEYACVADCILNEPRYSYYNVQLDRYLDLKDYAAAQSFREHYTRFRASSAYVDDVACGNNHSVAGHTFHEAGIIFRNWLLTNSGAAEGVCEPAAGQTAADPVHAADQPAVPRRMGS